MIKGLTQLEKDILSLSAPEASAAHPHITKDAIYSRKYNLQAKLKKAKLTEEKALKLPTIQVSELFLERHGGPKKARADTPKPQLPKVTADDLDKLFYIEDAPPPLPMGAEEERKAAMQRIKKIAADCAVNGAIVIPAKYRAAALKMLHDELGTAKWKPVQIPDNLLSVRIYKLNLPGKK